MEGLIIFIPMIAIMYFLFLRPQQKRQKTLAEMRNSLAVGDEITTLDGIVGKIVSLQDDFVTLETGEDRVRIKLCKWAIRAKGRATQEQAVR